MGWNINKCRRIKENQGTTVIYWSRNFHFSSRFLVVSWHPHVDLDLLRKRHPWYRNIPPFLNALLARGIISVLSAVVCVALFSRMLRNSGYMHIETEETPSLARYAKRRILFNHIATPPSLETRDGEGVLRFTWVRLKRNFGFSPENQIVDISPWRAGADKGYQFGRQRINVRSKLGASRSFSNLCAEVRPSNIKVDFGNTCTVNIKLCI